MSHLGKRLSALVDGELHGEERERVLAHLARCEPCRQEAAMLRMLKRRMRALGEATARDALTERLMAVAGQGGQTSEPGGLPDFLSGRPAAGRGRRPLWAAAAATVVLAVGLPAAGFALGGAQQAPGPQVTPAVDVFMVQHAITTGDTPARYVGVSSSPRAVGPSAGPGAASTTHPSARPVLRRLDPARPAPPTAGVASSPVPPTTRAVPTSP